MRTVLLLILYVFICCLIPLDAQFGLSSVLTCSEKMTYHTKSNINPSAVKVCLSLGLRRHQFKNCNSNYNVSMTLAKAIHISRRECTRLFRNEVWKCDYNETYRIRLIKRDFKESAFLYALSAASLVHSVARACARKSFSKRCGCYQSPSVDHSLANVRFSVCGDNLPFAVSYVKRFLELKRRFKDAHSTIVRHNIKVGIKAVVDSNTTTIECPPTNYGHQSCANSSELVKVKLGSFRKVSKLLKKYYKKAVRVRGSVDNKWFKLKRVSNTQLVYGTKSPDFCSESRFSPGNKGRRCSNHKQCLRICCKRNYRNYKTEKKRFCCELKIRGCCKPVCIRKCEKTEQQFECI